MTHEPSTTYDQVPDFERKHKECGNVKHVC